MVCVFPVCALDYARASNLLDWCAKLDRDQKGHSAVIVASKDMTREMVLALDSLAKAARFDHVVCIQQREAKAAGWPGAANEMFGMAATYMAEVVHKPWFWCEPDATPLKPGWLNKLELEYLAKARPFMGYVWDKPNLHMTGTAVYPSNVGKWNHYMTVADKLPFDTVRPDLVLPRCHVTRLIHHEWGDVESNMAWTFPDQKSLERIHPEAVIFHRCKDGTLIDRLGEQACIPVIMPPISVQPIRKGTKIAVTGLVKHHNPDMIKLLDSIDMMLHGLTWHGLFCVANLELQNAQEIKKWAKGRRNTVEVFREPPRLPEPRYSRMASLRNACLDILKESNIQPKYMLMIDMDIAGFAKWDGISTIFLDKSIGAGVALGLRPRFEVPHHPDGTVVDFGGRSFCYYDLLAFEDANSKRVLWPIGSMPYAWFLHGNVPAGTDFRTVYPINWNDQKYPVRVNSAFGPAAFYHWDTIKDLSYNQDGNQVEHIEFNAAIRSAGKSVVILPGFVALYSDPWGQVPVKEGLVGKLTSAIKRVVRA